MQLARGLSLSFLTILFVVVAVVVAVVFFRVVLYVVPMTLTDLQSLSSLSSFINAHLG